MKNELHCIPCCFFVCLIKATLCSYSQDSKWLDHGNIAVKGKFFFQEVGTERGKLRVIEYGLRCYNKGYDDLRRIYLHQHISTNAKDKCMGGQMEKILFQYLQ